MFDGFEQIRMGKKRIGYIASDGYFVTYRKPEHFFKLLEGWAISEDLLNYLNNKFIKGIRIIVRDKGKIKKILITTPSNWIKKGIPYKNPKFERQIILPEEYFDKIVEI
jgi:hypothetical protein